MGDAEGFWSERLGYFSAGLPFGRGRCFPSSSSSLLQSNAKHLRFLNIDTIYFLLLFLPIYE